MGPLRSSFAAIWARPLIWCVYGLIQIGLLATGYSSLVSVLHLPTSSQSHLRFATRTLPVSFFVGFLNSALSFFLSVCAYRLAIQQLRDEPLGLPNSTEIPRLSRRVALLAVGAVVYNTAASLVAQALAEGWNAIWIEQALWFLVVPPFAFVLPLIADTRIGPSQAVRISLHAWRAHPLQMQIYVPLLFVASLFGAVCLVGLVLTLAIYPLGIASLYLDYFEVVRMQTAGHT